ncbi:MAG: NADH-quinone oxidoreductase subunit C [Pyrodictiaceae archaeon]
MSSPVDEIKLALSGLIEAIEQRKNFVAVRVPADKLKEAARRLQELGYDRLILVTGIDEFKEKKIRVVYHFEKYEDPGRVVALETLVPRDNPVVPSLHDLWGAAILQEREEHEMLGIRFEGHPDLRKILLPPDWPDNLYPLRKDYRVREEPFMSTKPSKPIWELKPELKPKESEAGTKK